MGSKAIDFDPVTQAVQIFHPSDDGNRYTIETKQDVTEIIEANKRAYAGVDERARFGHETFTRVANIPMSILMDLDCKGILRDKKSFEKWLNNPDNKYFRTRPGRV